MFDDISKYRDYKGNWRPRRKPHFIPLVGGTWRCVRRVPGGSGAYNAIGRTPAEALHYVETLQ